MLGLMYTHKKRLRHIWSRIHLIPGLLLPHFLSPWTNCPKKFSPHPICPPGQMDPKNLVPLDKWSPTNLGPINYGPNVQGLYGFGTKCVTAKKQGRRQSIFCFVLINLGKKNHEMLAALQYKLLYNISRSEKGVKKIQAAAYNGPHTIYHPTRC